MIKYDITIIGAGPGGYVSAIRAAQLGAKVCLIEKNKVGGACLHRGCIPTKSFISTVKTLRTVREAENFGVEIEGKARPNLAKIRERTSKIIEELEKGVHYLVKSNGIDLKPGKATLMASNKVSITGQDGGALDIEADKIILAVGSSPVSLPMFRGFEVLSTDTVFSLKQIPDSIIIVGGGVTGCEFAYIFNELGVRVTVLELEPQLLPGEEPEIVKILRREFKKKKIRVLCGQKAEKVEESDGLKKIYLEDGEAIEAEKVLVTVGRTPNTTKLGLDGIGVKVDPRGNVVVDEKMQTSVPGIFAIGDITGKWLLAHVASKEGIIAAENAMGVESTMDYSAIPAAVFTDPEIGSVGLSCHEAEKQGLKVKVGKFSTRALGKARIMNERTGEIRLTMEEKTGKLLGARIIGPSASELIHEAAFALANGLTVKDIGETIHAHPTLSEAVMEAAWDGYKSAIHS